MHRTSSDSSTDETEHRLPQEIEEEEEFLEEFKEEEGTGDDESEASEKQPRSVGGGSSAGGGAGGASGNPASPGKEEGEDRDEGLVGSIIDGVLRPFRKQEEIDDEGRGIPGSKLESWSKTGPSVSTKQTSDSIKRALRNDPRLQSRDIEYSVYIQGSYKNSTNIHGNSDVDIVIQLDAPYQIKQRDGEARIVRPDGTETDYTYSEFKQEVIAALQRRYGDRAVQIGDKAIEIHSSESTLPIDADVVIAQQVQTKNPAGGTQQGMRFKTRRGKEIVNYPKQHYSKGAAKNKRTGGEYKKTLRMFKRARSYLVKQGRISKDQVPSYFLVCLLYNVPDQAYSVQDPGANDHQRRFTNVVNHLKKNDINAFTTQNEAHARFGSDSIQWDRRAANQFVDELIRLWKNWYT